MSLVTTARSCQSLYFPCMNASSGVPVSPFRLTLSSVWSSSSPGQLVLLLPVVLLFCPRHRLCTGLYSTIAQLQQITIAAVCGLHSTHHAEAHHQSCLPPARNCRSTPTIGSPNKAIFSLSGQRIPLHRISIFSTPQGRIGDRTSPRLWPSFNSPFISLRHPSQLSR